jgi:hypothetical protein
VLRVHLQDLRSGKWLRHLLMPLGGFLVITYVLIEMDNAAKIMGACWIAAGIVYFVLLSFLLKKPVALDF